MKDSQPRSSTPNRGIKYIKANNERFSTGEGLCARADLSISRRIMKDSQHRVRGAVAAAKYIKANNERFSTKPAQILEEG